MIHSMLLTCLKGRNKERGKRNATKLYGSTDLQNTILKLACCRNQANYTCTIQKFVAKKFESSF